MTTVDTVLPALALASLTLVTRPTIVAGSRTITVGSTRVMFLGGKAFVGKFELTGDADTIAVKILTIAA